MARFESFQKLDDPAVLRLLEFRVSIFQLLPDCVDVLIELFVFCEQGRDLTFVIFLNLVEVSDLLLQRPHGQVLVNE